MVKMVDCTCLVCAAPFQIKASWVGRRGYGKFCSRLCRTSFQRRPKTGAELLQSIENSVEFDPNAGCWLWWRGLNSDGYGSCGIRGFSRKAHRASWEIHKGPIPPGLHVLHRCDTPACVNPDHLFVGTHFDNMSDAARKGRLKIPPRGGQDAKLGDSGRPPEPARIEAQPRETGGNHG